MARLAPPPGASKSAQEFAMGGGILRQPQTRMQLQSSFPRRSSRAPGLPCSTQAASFLHVMPSESLDPTTVTPSRHWQAVSSVSVTVTST